MESLIRGNFHTQTVWIYLGSLYCKDIYDINSLEDDHGLFKCYIALYTCPSTRGVVLELVPNASSKYFAYSFRKCIAHRVGCSE